MIDFEKLGKNLGYKFRDRGLLERALTLSSFDADGNNEKLECLGDALLTFIVTEKYFHENLDEGQITAMKQALVSDEALRPVSERLGLAEALKRDKGDTRNKKAVPSAYEAVAAAIYLDGGLEQARNFALSTLTPLPVAVSAVSQLQELLQGEGEGLPVYKKIMGGTPQSPKPKITVTVKGQTFEGEGASFAEAKRQAAARALQWLKG